MASGIPSAAPARMGPVVLLLLLLLATETIQTSTSDIVPEGVCPEQYTMCSGVCYYRPVSSWMTYDGAEHHCASMDAHLPVPRTRNETRCVLRLGGRWWVTWLGVTDRRVEGVFEAADGTPAERLDASWWDDEPDDYKGSDPAGEDCVAMDGYGDRPVWYDYSCSDTLPFVCQRPPIACGSDSECASDRFCFGDKCVDPCTMLDQCHNLLKNGVCHTRNHRPECSCPPGYSFQTGSNSCVTASALPADPTPPSDDPASQLLPRPPTCGQRQTRLTDVTTADRVAGGEPVLRGEFPWQAQIRSWDSKSRSWVHTCGGVIISDRFVLTAAHCMRKALSEYEVIVGQYDRRVRERSERVFAIKEKVDLPDYLANDTKVGDLAVLKLDLSNRPAITFSTEVRPACLIRPEDPAPAVNSDCVISGWGSTLPGFREFPSRLRGTEVPIVSDDFCRTYEVYDSTFIPEKMICAGFVKGGVDSCKGDSGGGLVCPAADGSWQVVGIVATGDVDCGAVGKPGIYTELQPYYKKILDILKALSSVDWS